MNRKTWRYGACLVGGLGLGVTLASGGELMSLDDGTTVRFLVVDDGRTAVGDTPPDPWAQLDVQSTTRGFLPPRLTETNRDAITTPTAGLIIYNATTNRLNIHDGTVWNVLTMTPTTAAGDFSDDFSSYASTAEGDAAWPTSAPAKARVNPANDDMDVSFTEADSTTIAHDLGAGAVSDTAWVLRFKMHQTSHGTSQTTYFGLSSAGIGVTSSGAQSFIGLGKSDHVSADKLSSADSEGAAPANDTQVGEDSEWVDGTDYYFEVIRTTSTAYTVEVFTDPGYSVSKLATTGTVSGSLTGLRYIKFMANDTAGGATLVATIDDVQFYNGVTSAP